MEIKIEFSDRTYTAIDKALQRLDRIGQELQEIRSLIGKQFITGEVCEPVDSGAVVPINHYKVTLVTHKPYTFEAFEIMTKEMTEWLAEHHKKPGDIMCTTCTDFHDTHFVGKIRDVVLSNREIERCATSDKYILNICGHPWYLSGTFEPVDIGG